ncbi:hypothetical protein GALL_520730 [mine drainage metagenome]|uniref:Uncharacterized protein n=1 Tax=mine drainage metagenome TaxID=410659 RepID=A0A1J5P6H2_9ZZZZ
MSYSAQHSSPVPRQPTGVGEIAGERFEHIERLLDFCFLKGERDILGKRIGNDNEARRRQIMNHNEIIGNFTTRSDFDFRNDDGWRV